MAPSIRCDCQTRVGRPQLRSKLCDLSGPTSNPQNFFLACFPICHLAAHQDSKGLGSRGFMETEATHHTSEEIRRVLGRVRKADLLRFAALARVWTTGLPKEDANDLLSEALDRILAGRRLWPIDVPFPTFLSQVMRSIASQWRKGERFELLDEEGQGGGEFTTPKGNLPSHDPTSEFEINDLISRMRHSLENEQIERGVFDHIIADTKREHAIAALNISSTQYDTARRRMVRLLFENFHEGWRP